MSSKRIVFQTSLLPPVYLLLKQLSKEHNISMSNLVHLAVFALKHELGKPPVGLMNALFRESSEVHLQ